MNVLLDGTIILDREMLHDTLATGLRLPPWYGRNLDALYDCLTDVQEETVVILRDQAALDIHHKTPMMAQIAALRKKYNLKMRVERYVDAPKNNE